MKRFLMLVGVAVVAAAMYVAASPASQQAKGPTAKQFKALKNQVTALGHTVKGLKAAVAAELTVLEACDQHAVPIGQFGDAQNQTEGYHYLLPSAPGGEIITTALDVANPADPNTVFLAYGDTSCNTLLNPTALRHAAARAGVRVTPAPTHAPSFVPHGR